nr:MAG TPA: hypothetical protein [Caudoviricetes sp.]
MIGFIISLPLTSLFAIACVSVISSTLLQWNPFYLTNCNTK